MHRIHAYPAKFPAFITTKAIEYADTQGVSVDRLVDFFCGCGTTAYESKKEEIDYWGCDINPVATLIAKVKSTSYRTSTLDRHFNSICELFRSHKIERVYSDATPRLKYWYRPTQYNALVHLLWSIERSVPSNSKYRKFFECAFSNILKATSVWLTKSIKPQVDPDKEPAKVIWAFEKQFAFMRSAVDESDMQSSSTSEIVTRDFLSDKCRAPTCDLVVTSPPYVTSYEYADLHQLSSLWLGFADDYRELRNGAIGSMHHDHLFDSESTELNEVGKSVVSDLHSSDRGKANMVSKYFMDMQAVARKTKSSLRDGGMAVFVIGNTEYKGVRIDNVRHLAQSMTDSGFSNIRAAKRRISKKILTPYRDAKGKFSTDATGRKVYAEEYVLVGSV